MPDTPTTNLPGISVVVPSYNSEGCIRQLLDGLVNIDYPKDKLEIIVVDNNSTDKTKEIIKQYPVTLLEETSIQSSYAARNKGIKHANNDLLAFTDADCIPEKQWLKEGAEALRYENADLVGGKVEFILSENATAAQIYDSITHMQAEVSIKNKTAPTANLFTKTSLFDKIGMFAEVKSGEDFQWTSKASSQQFRLVYSEKAIVKHPARNLKELLKKTFRTGSGFLHKRLSSGITLGHELLYIPYILLIAVIPSNRIKTNVNDANRSEVNKKLIRILMVGYLCQLSSRLGSLIELVRIALKKLLKRKSNRDK